MKHEVKARWTRYGDRSPWFVRIDAGGFIPPMPGDIVTVIRRGGGESKVRLGTKVQDSPFGSTFAVESAVYGEP